MSATIEMVTFKLSSNASEKEFLAASPKVDIWAKQQDGFEYRALSKKQDGSWVDLFFWQSEAAANKAGESFMAAEEPKDMCALIDSASVDMQRMPVISSLACDAILEKM